MDKIARLQGAMLKVLERYKVFFQKLEGDVLPYVVADTENNHYQFLWFGWKEGHHVFRVSFHAHIQNNKIYMFQDRTEVGIADWLVEEGIDKQDIVLGYFSPKHREFTDFAVN